MRSTVTGSSSSTANQSWAAALPLKVTATVWKSSSMMEPPLGLARTDLDAVHQQILVRGRRPNGSQIL